MPPPLTPEDELARFEALFSRTYADVAAFCTRRSATPQDAEEAATDVYAIAWRRRADVPPAPDDRLWLFGVARRVLANQARTSRRRDRLLGRLRAEASRAAPVAPPAAPHASPAARALNALSDGDRELLVMVAWDDLTVAQIAEVLSVPAPVVSRRLHRARRRFAHVLSTAERRSSSEPRPAGSPA